VQLRHEEEVEWSDSLNLLPVKFSCSRRAGALIYSGFQGAKQLPPFSDPSKSEGLRGLYSLSVYVRSDRKEVFLR
jgi:hypothetical protein